MRGRCNVVWVPVVAGVPRRLNSQIKTVAIGRKGRKLDRLSRPKCIMKFFWEYLAELSIREVLKSHLWKSFSQILREAIDIESELSMFSASIVNMAALSCGRTVSGAIHGRKPITR